jgi:chromosome partitioning protein
MRTLSILSQKGGVGKSTLAIHLAVAAEQAGVPSLLFDIDPQGNAYKWFRRRQPAASGAPPVPPYVKALQHVELEEALARPHGAELVLIDTPSSTDPATLAAAAVADLILIPMKPSIMDLDVITNTIKLARMEGKDHVVVFTMIEPQGAVHEEFRHKVRNSKIEVCPYGTGRRVAYHHGLIGHGQTALEFDPKGKAAQETRHLFGYLRRRIGLSGRPKARRPRDEEPDVQTRTA